MAALAKLGDPLSNQETSVLGLVADGLSDRLVADKLSIGVDTVKTHLRRCYQKLGATGRAHAVYLAFGQDGGATARLARARKIIVSHRGVRQNAPAGSRFAAFYDQLAEAMKDKP